MEMEKKESRGENNVTKKLLERQLRHPQPSSRLLKSLLLEISTTISFHSEDLKLMPKYRQMNKLSCGIKIIGS